MTSSDRGIERIVGCFMGGAIGDAWGSQYEGSVPPVSVDLTDRWFLTDDTQLTLATCEAIVAGRGVNPERIAAGFARAFSARLLVGLGASTYQALESLAAGGHWALVGRKGDQAAGNGAAMRIAPLAFCLDLSVSRERQMLRDVCRITHHNDEAYAGALAIVLAIQAVVAEIWNGGAGLIAHVVGQLPDSALRDRMVEFETLDPLTPLDQLARQYGNSGYAVESVPFALFAAQQAHGSDFASWIRRVIEAGGDTDTIASMAGQVVGCCLGLGGIPEELIARVPDIGQLQTQMTTFAGYVVSLGQDYTMHCPHCQATVDSDAQRCPNCWAWLAEAAQSDDELQNSIRSLLRQGNKIEAIRIYRQHTGVGLFEAKTAVELIERGEPLPDSEAVADDLEKRILELMAAGQKIAAIKLHRERTHVGLKESKDAVEALASRHGVTVPGRTGCFGVVLMVLFGVLLVIGWMSAVQQ